MRLYLFAIAIANRHSDLCDDVQDGLNDPSDLPTILDPNTCVRKGLCPVTVLRGQRRLVESHSPYFCASRERGVLHTVSTNPSRRAAPHGRRQARVHPRVNLVPRTDQAGGNATTPWAG